MNCGNHLEMFMKYTRVQLSSAQINVINKQESTKTKLRFKHFLYFKSAQKIISSFESKISGYILSWQTDQISVTQNDVITNRWEAQYIEKLGVLLVEKNALSRLLVLVLQRLKVKNFDLFLVKDYQFKCGYVNLRQGIGTISSKAKYFFIE